MGVRRMHQGCCEDRESSEGMSPLVALPPYARGPLPCSRKLRHVSHVGGRQDHCSLGGSYEYTARYCG